MGRGHRLVAPAAVVGGLAVATVALRLRDPHVPGSWGICPTAAVGFACPGCGALRAVNHLTHGQVAEAASSNLLLVLAVPLVLIALTVWTVERWRAAPRLTPRLAAAATGPAGYAALGVIVLFAAARNLPAGSWLAP